jgi:hypothetical protein
VSRPEQSHNRKYFRAKAPVQVFLSCGCKVWMRSVPLPMASMTCGSGLGHGYRLRWVRAIAENGYELGNRKAEE